MAWHAVNPITISLTPEEIKELEKRELDHLETEDRQNKITQLKPGDAITERQKKVITALNSEKKNLIKDLNLIKSERTQRLNNDQAVKITELFEEVDLLDSALKIEKQYLSDLDKQILETRNAIYQAKRKKQFAAEKGRLHCSEQKITNMQNQLYAASVKLNETKKENLKLKEEIDLQMIARQKFNEMYNKQLQQLEAGKAVVADVLRQSAETYNKRETVIKKLNALKEHNKADKKKRRDEVQDLHMKYEQCVKLRDFSQTKFQKRRMKETEKRQELKEEQDRWKKRQLKAKYEEIYKKITEFFETDDIEAIKKEFVKGEAWNMMLLNSAIESNCELEVLTAQTQAQMREYQELKTAASEQETFQLNKVFILKEELSKLKQDAKIFQEKFDEIEELIRTLFEGLMTLFVTSECDRWPLELLLGENVQVNKFNYRLYCNLVEEKVTELLRVVNLPQMQSQFQLLANQTKAEKSSMMDISSRMFSSGICEMCMGTFPKTKEISFFVEKTDK